MENFQQTQSQPVWIHLEKGGKQKGDGSLEIMGELGVWHEIKQMK